ncbi:hypothetical protein JCM19300_2504 [Algibacter lectus]|uniref:Uncharacterized protein n=1 Tax=Algibacter lectus TaxID=221126 RepID=A0A090VCG7_9FLAO|nr:hypothetical protein JCM19300_2504 [Algibacter lectus]
MFLSSSSHIFNRRSFLSRSWLEIIADTWGFRVSKIII